MSLKVLWVPSPRCQPCDRIYGDDAGLGGIFPNAPSSYFSVSRLFRLLGFSSHNPVNIQTRAQLTSGSIDSAAAMWNIADLLRALKPQCEITEQSSIGCVAFKSRIGQRKKEERRSWETDTGGQQEEESDKLRRRKKRSVWEKQSIFSVVCRRLSVKWKRKESWLRERVIPARSSGHCPPPCLQTHPQVSPGENGISYFQFSSLISWSQLSIYILYMELLYKTPFIQNI